MKLEQYQKDDLGDLVNHRWFSVLELIVKDMEYNLLKKFKTANLWDPNIWQELNWVQNKLSWAEELISTAKSCINQPKQKSIN